MGSAEKADIREVILDGIKNDVSIVDISILYEKMTEYSKNDKRDLLIREDAINENLAVINVFINNNKQVLLNDLINEIRNNKSLVCIHTLEDYIQTIDYLEGVDQQNTIRCYRRIVQDYAAYIEMHLSKNR